MFFLIEKSPLKRIKRKKSSVKDDLRKVKCCLCEKKVSEISSVVLVRKRSVFEVNSA